MGGPSKQTNKTGIGPPKTMRSLMMTVNHWLDAVIANKERATIY